MSTDSWTKPVSGGTTEEDEIENLARDVAALEKEQDTIAKALGPKKERLAAYFPEEVGEHTRTVNGVNITVKRSESLEWDTDILDQLFVTTPLPDFVSKKLSVPKRKWDKLDDTTKQGLLPALTRKPGAPRISIDI